MREIRTVNRKTLALLGAYVVMLATVASVMAQTPAMQDAKKKTKTPAYEQTNLVVSGKPLKGKVRDKNLLNPWGLVQGRSPFWIGNFGDGNINAFDQMGNSKGQPTDDKIKPLNVDGLWALVFGDGTNNAATTSLYFTAGPNKETEGIFGKFDVTTKESKSSGASDMPGPDPGMM